MRKQIVEDTSEQPEAAPKKIAPKRKPRAAPKKKAAPKRKSPVKKAAPRKKAEPKQKALTVSSRPLESMLTSDDRYLVALNRFITMRKKMMGFVKRNLKEDIDYGKQYPGDKKKNILKPGCEKVTTWLKLTRRIFPDWDSWRMLGEDQTTVCMTMYLVCEEMGEVLRDLVMQFGVENEELCYRMLAVATGKGAASVTEKVVETRNVAVKKCKIRTFKDATLSLGLSGEFTQDMGNDNDDNYTDDMTRKTATVTTEPLKKPERKTQSTQPTKRALTDKQVEEKLIKYGMKIEEYLNAGIFTTPQTKSFHSKADAHHKSKDLEAMEALGKTISMQYKNVIRKRKGN